MKLKIAYYGHCRKDGSYNMVSFDTAAKTFVNWDGGFSKDVVLVEAKLSSDVDALRKRLKADGYLDITEKGETRSELPAIH